MTISLLASFALVMWTIAVIAALAILRDASA
jgi:hypothetical protein